MSLILLICLSACSSTKTNYYNMSFKYNDLEIIVTSVEESIDNNGYYDTTISFSVSNNGTQKYDLRSIDIYLKNAETKSKHNKNSISVVRSEHTEDYKVNFTLPFSVGTIKYIMFFDFGSLGFTIGKCALYYEDDSMIEVENSGRYFAGPCPISLSNIQYFTKSQTLSITHKNQSDKTILAIKYLLVIYDVYGKELKKYGYGSSVLTATYDDWATNPGDFYTGGWKLNGFTGGKQLDIYIYSVLFTDHTEYGNRNLSVGDIKSYAPKEHVIGIY